MTAETLIVFIPLALALNLTPGADMLFCLGAGMRGGPRAGIAASLGVATGGMVHALAAGIGLAALITAHPALFEAIRWAGVGYLLWLAVEALRAAPPMAETTKRATDWREAFRKGALVNLLNPKVAIFTLAILPQFVDPARGSVVGQFLILGAILSIGGAVVNGLVGGFAGGIGRRLAQSPRLARGMQAASAAIFVALAARLAFDRR